MVILGLTSLLGIFIIFKTTVNVQSFLEVISQLDMRYFWLAFATIPPTIILNAARWYYVLRAAGFSIPFKRILVIATGSLPFIVIPGRLGDFIRSYPLRNEVPINRTIATIILEKIIDVCSLLVYASIGLFFLGYYLGSAATLLIAVAAIPGLIIFKKLKIARPTKNKIIEKIYDAAEILDRVHERKGLLGMSALCSIMNMGLSMLEFYWLMLAVHASLPITVIFAFLPFSLFVGLIPLTLAGTGIREAAMIYFFKFYALPGELLSAGIFYTLQGYWIAAILGLPFLYFFFKTSTSQKQ